MNAESETRLPALLSPSIQNAMRVLSILSIAGVGLIAWWSTDSTETRDPDGADPRRLSFQIDVNEAGLRELTLMPGIGTLTAERIIDDRKQNGPFRSLGDLARVPGIGPKTIKEISPYCRPVSRVTEDESERLVAERLVAERLVAERGGDSRDGTVREVAVPKVAVP